MASSPVRAVVAAYAAGRVKADKVVEAVVPVYFRAPPGKTRDTLRPLVEVIERAAPGVVELAGGDPGGGAPGFQVRLAERPFPKAFEGELRNAAEATLGKDWSWDKEAGLGTRDSGLGLVARVFGAMKRLFTASR